jgi:hypothetical protein
LSSIAWRLGQMTSIKLTMIILIDSPRSIKKYNTSIKQKDIDVDCPICNRRTKKHGKYKRMVHTKNQSYQISVLRRRCSYCDHTFSLLPCFLTPRARFSNVFREFIGRWLLRGIPLAHLEKQLTHNNIPTVSLRTLRRWKKRFKERFEVWMSEQRMNVAHNYSQGVAVLELYCRGMNPIEECEFYLTVFFGGEQNIPARGRLLSTLNLRLPLSLSW